MTQNPSSSFEQEGIPEKDVENRLRDFDDLLNEIESLTEKKKQLWKEIYQNAIRDRQNAYLTLSQLLKLSYGKSTELAIHGRTISSMLERMSKSNDQLIRLAELIAKAETPQNDTTVTADDVFSRIRQTDS